MEGFSVVRSYNTKNVFWNQFFLTFHQLQVIWEKIVRGKLSVLLSSATEAFFREMTISLFFKFSWPFCQFLTFLRQYKPCKEPLVIRLEMICRTQMYLTSKDTSTPWTSCRYNVIFPIIYPPFILKVNQVKVYTACIANRQILRGRGRKLVFLQCFCIFFSDFFPPSTLHIKLDKTRIMFVFCS